MVEEQVVPVRNHPNAAPRVRVTAARHVYGGLEVLHGVSLDLNAGEIYGLLGPNGAGKTTLMKAMCGRLRLTGGQIAIDGQDISRSHSARRNVSYVPQDIAIFPHLTVQENLQIFGRLAGVSRGDLKLAVNGLLVEAQLSDRANQLCRTLSGGFQRRVNICASVLHKPLALLLDEPTVGIDIDAREAIHGLLHALRAQGTALLIATHDLDQAQQLCDRIGLIIGGNIVMEGVPNALISAHFGNDREVIVTLGRAAKDVGTIALRGMGLRLTQSPLTWFGRLPAANVDAANLGHRLEAAGLDVKEIRVRVPDLKSLFLDTVATGGGVS
jgi:ABC-2 type transport system ATP-binding protein